MNLNRTLKLLVPAILIGFLLVAVALPWFIKARDKSQYNYCMYMLEQIDAAKFSYAMESSLSEGTALDEKRLRDLNPYLHGGWKDKQCLTGGKYTVGRIGELPSCTVHGTLPTNLMRR